MNRTPLRAIALVLLLSSFLALSGVALAAAVLAQPEHADACCGGSGEPVAPAPCATLDCPCPSCLTVELSDPPTLATPTGMPGALWRGSVPCPAGNYAAAIDYPPEG